MFNSGLVFRFSRTLHVLSELEQEKRTWRLIGSLYNDRQTSLDTIPTMDMETDMQVRPRSITIAKTVEEKLGDMNIGLVDGSLYNDRQTSLDTIPTMDMETDMQVTQMALVYNAGNRGSQCDIRVPTRWQLSTLLL